MGLGELLFLVNADGHNVALFSFLARGKIAWQRKSHPEVAIWGGLIR